MTTAWASIGATAEAPTQGFSLVATSWYIQTAINNTGSVFLLFLLGPSLSILFILIFIFIFREKRGEKMKKK